MNFQSINISTVKNVVSKLFVLNVIFVTILNQKMYAQNSCQPCENKNSNDTLIKFISTRDTSVCTLNNGYMLCITQNGFFIGKLILNGGKVCNKGVFHPKNINFNSGEIINSRNAMLNNSLNLGPNKKIKNTPKSTLSITGKLLISGGTFENEGLIDVKDTLVNYSGLFINKSIINCLKYTGSNQFNNYPTSLINSRQ